MKDYDYVLLFLGLLGGCVSLGVLLWKKDEEAAQPTAQGMYEHSRKPISNEPCPNCKGETPPTGPFSPVCAMCNGCGLMTQFGKSMQEVSK